MLGHRAFLDTQPGGDFGPAHAVGAEQDEHLAPGARQAHQLGDDPLDDLALGDQMVGCGCGPVRMRRAVLQSPAAGGLLAAVMVDAQIVGDAEKQGAGRLDGDIELALQGEQELFVGALGNVVGVCAIAQLASQKAAQFAVMREDVGNGGGWGRHVRAAGQATC